MTTLIYNTSMEKTDQQIMEEYYISQGLRCTDIGSVPLLRRNVNDKLKEKGYAKLKGRKPKRQLIAIMRSI